MVLPPDAEIPLTVDRWAIPLDEPQGNPGHFDATSLAIYSDDTYLDEIPGEDFQPRLSRYDEAA